VKYPETKKLKPPLYWVTMCDMFNLLLAFYICMVSMSETRAFGLINVGKGIAINRTNAKGFPGVGTGQMKRVETKYVPDSWWVDDQQGDPDQLDVVAVKLDEALKEHFKEDDAKIAYQKNSLLVTLPARIKFYITGTPLLDPGTMGVLRIVSQTVHQGTNRMVRISGDVPASGSFDRDLASSARQGFLISYWLQRLGVEPRRISLWGFGSSRPIIASNPASPANSSLTIEIWEAQE
jgi:flagellar motor protein MotB